MYHTPDHNKAGSAHNLNITPIHDAASPYNGTVLWSVSAQPHTTDTGSSDSEVEHSALVDKYTGSSKQTESNENTDNNVQQRAISARKYISASKTHKAPKRQPHSATAPKRAHSVDAHTKRQSMTQDAVAAATPPVQHNNTTNEHREPTQRTLGPGKALDVDAFLTTLPPSASVELLHTKLSALRAKLQQYHVEQTTRLLYSEKLHSSITQLELINSQLHTNTKNLEEHVQFLLQRNAELSGDGAQQQQTTLKQLRGIALEQAIHRQHELSHQLIERENDIRTLQHQLTSAEIAQFSHNTAQTEELQRLRTEIEQLRTVSSISQSDRTKQIEQHTMAVAAYQQQLAELQQQCKNTQTQYNDIQSQYNDLTQQYNHTVDANTQLQAEEAAQHDTIVAQQQTIDTQNHLLLTVREEVATLKHQLSSNNAEHTIEQLRQQHDRELASLVDIHSAELDKLRKQLLSAHTTQYNGVQTAQLQQTITELQQQLTVSYTASQQQTEQYKQLQSQYTALQLNSEQITEQYTTQIQQLQQHIDTLQQRNTELHAQINDVLHSHTSDNISATLQHTVNQLQLSNDQLTADNALHQQHVTQLQQQVAELHDKLQAKTSISRQSLNTTVTQQLVEELKAECIELSKLNESLLDTNNELKANKLTLTQQCTVLQQQLDSSEQQCAALHVIINTLNSEIQRLKQLHSTLQTNDTAEQVQQLTEQLAQQSTALSAAEQRVIALQQELLDSQNVHSTDNKFTQYVQHIDQLQQYNAELQHQLQQLQQSHNTVYLTQSEHQLVKECERCVNVSHSALLQSPQPDNRSVQHYNKRIEQLTAENNALEQQVEQLRHSNTVLQQQLDEAELTNQSLQARETTLSTTKKHLREQLATAQASALHSSSHDIVQRYTQQIDALTAENDNIQQRVDALLRETHKLNHTITAQQSEIEQLQHTEHTLNNKIAGLRAQLADPQQLQASSSDHTVRMYKEQIVKLQHELDGAEQQQVAAHADTKNKQQQIASLQSELQQSSSDKTQLQAKVKQLAAELADTRRRADNAESELTASKHTIKQYEKQVRQLSSELEQTQSQLSSLTATHKQCSITVSSLRSEVDTTTEQLQRTEQKVKQLQAETLQAATTNVLATPALNTMNTSTVGTAFPTRTVSLPQTSSQITLHITAVSDSAAPVHQSTLQVPLATPALHTVQKSNRLLNFDSDDDDMLSSPTRTSRHVAAEFNTLFTRLNNSSQLLQSHAKHNKPSKLSEYINTTDSDDDVATLIQSSTHKRTYPFIQHAQSALKPRVSTVRKQHAVKPRVVNTYDKRRMSTVSKQQQPTKQKRFMNSPISAPDLVDRSQARALEKIL